MRHMTRHMTRVVQLVVAMALLFPPATPAAAQGVILPPPRCFDVPVPLPGPLPFPIPEPLPEPPAPPTADASGAVAAPGVANNVLIQPAPPFQGVLPPIRPLPTPGRPIVPQPPVRPIFPCWLTLRSHAVAVEIQDQVATTRVDQVFLNETGRDLEGTYLFPLPEDAIVTSFSMFVDGQQITGEVLTREEARRIYESIVRANRDPALLEFAGRGAFQAQVFPVPAGGQRTIRLEYSQVLPQDGSGGEGSSRMVRYVYPTSAERFSARPSQETSFRVSIKTAQPLRSIYSPTHEVAVSRSGENGATVSWSSKVDPTRSAVRGHFELVYGVSPNPVGLSLLTSRPAGEDGYFLLLAAPSVQLASSGTIAKDVTLIFDTSGSMAGAKIEQAKGALRYVINRLNPEDRFNIVSFASTVNTFSGGMQPASERDRALAYVDGLVATGGTNINDALITALRLHASDSSGRPHTVVFVTDGLPTVGPQQPEQIIQNAQRAAGTEGGARWRLFTFGVGFDVNTTLLDKLATDFGGTSAYVRPQENLEEAVSAFYAKVSAPVLTDLRLDFGGADVYDLFPARLPDLYAGSQLVLSGRYRRSGTFDVTLAGSAGGRAQQFALSGATFAGAPVKGQEALPRLWAGRKIGFLLAEIRLRGANKELVDEIVTLATRYGIATPYTSIFVPEPTGAARSTPPTLPGQMPAPQPAQAPLNTQQGRADAAEQLQRGVAAAPSSGAGAVQNSLDANKLQDSQSAQTANSANVQVIADKTFLLVEGVWNDVSTGQDAPAPEARIRVPFASAEYFALIDHHPAMAQYLSAGARVLLTLDGTWYEVTEG